MPAAPLIPGFYGKLPSTGDFVARNLPPSFTIPWDRWLARHLADLPADAPPLYFRRSDFSGVVLPSHDRSGRRFPLTLAVCGSPSPHALAPLAILGTDAIASRLDPDTLAARLAATPLSDCPADPAPLLRTDPAHTHPADPAAQADPAHLLVWTKGADIPAEPAPAGPARLLLWTDPAQIHPADPAAPAAVLAALIKPVEAG